MANLGSAFGAATREFTPDSERDTFEVCGESFTVEAMVPAMLELEVCAGLVGKVSGVLLNAAVYEAYRFALTKPEREVDGKTVPADDSQWRRFRQLTVARQVDEQDLSLLMLSILGAQNGRPTVQRSTSADGSLPTSTSSNTSASDSGLRPVDEALGGSTT